MDRGRQPKVVVFTTPTCPWCRATKRYLREKGIRFYEVDVSKDSRALKDMVRKTGQTGVPVILVNNRPVVGFNRPKLDRLLGLK